MGSDVVNDDVVYLLDVLEGFVPVNKKMFLYHQFLLFLKRGGLSHFVWTLTIWDCMDP